MLSLAAALNFDCFMLGAFIFYASTLNTIQKKERKTIETRKRTEMDCHKKK